MHKGYQELTITLDDRFVDLIADYITTIYDGGIEMGDGKVIVRSENDLGYIQEAINSLSETLGDSLMLACNISEKSHTDWIEVYQNSVQPIEAGKFYIHPSWNKPKKDKINIIVDPALAFGSGHHGSTYACLEAIEEYVKPKQTVLDVGCGSGILGLAAAKIGAVIDLCDTDPVSIESTQKNFSLNQETYRHLWEGSVNKTQEKYDIVIANIVADVLRAISPALQKSIRDNGLLIISGILDTKESLVLDAYTNLILLDRKQRDEWVTLIYQKENNG